MKLKPYTIIAILAFIILLAIVLFGKNNSGLNKLPSGKVQVVASFYPLYFFASEIGKDKAEVVNITPVGAEPHDYEPTPKQIAGIEKSDLLILLGGLEPWGEKIKTNLKGKPVKIETLGADLEILTTQENGQTFSDPHVWLDPSLAITLVNRITAAMGQVDPNNQTFYETGDGKDLSARLNALDREYQAGLASCKSKDIVTSHAAFGYLAKRYGLNQIAITGISPDEEPSAQRLAEVVQFARDHNVKYIFFESLVSPKLSETIASEVGAKTLVLDPIEGISDDEIKQGKNYFTKMKQNLKNLQIALECTQ